MVKGAVGRPCHRFLPTQLQAVFWVCNKELWIHWGGERDQKDSQLLRLPQSPNGPQARTELGWLLPPQTHEEKRKWLCKEPHYILAP